MAALLAEVVAVHTNEWTTPWGEVLKARDRGGPGVAHAPLSDAWPSNAAALGLPDGKLRYYHPLRLLEWLTTGVAVRVHLLGTKPGDVAASLRIGGDAGDGQEFDLLATTGGDEVTCFQRALLARSLPSDGTVVRSATVAVHHTKAAIPEVPVTLRRGEITRVELCEPGATVLRATPCGRPEPAARRRRSPAMRDDRVERDDDALPRHADELPPIQFLGDWAQGHVEPEASVLDDDEILHHRNVARAARSRREPMGPWHSRSRPPLSFGSAWRACRFASRSTERNHAREGRCPRCRRA